MSTLQVSHDANENVKKPFLALFHPILQKTNVPSSADKNQNYDYHNQADRKKSHQKIVIFLRRNFGRC